MHVSEDCTQLILCAFTNKSFRPLLIAVREGGWVVLDELNLAPPEVTEGLNRLLDDNREIYVSEIDETVKAHKEFRLFATQNPSSYGGRKLLSEALRSRFIEFYITEPPAAELVHILMARCPGNNTHTHTHIHSHTVTEEKYESGICQAFHSRWPV